MGIMTRFKNAWNVFLNKDPTMQRSMTIGPSHYYRPDRVQLSRGADKTIVSTVLNRIALDAASIDIKHIRVDENDRYMETIKSNLNECLTTEANIDQQSRAFFQDVYLSMFDEGHVVIVPTDTDVDIENNNAFDVLTMRTGKVKEWYPQHVKVNLYNERTGEREDVVVPKKSVAIIENPFYVVMNEYNSTMQRLVRKLALLDAVDDTNYSGKLDLIIQLPYTIKSEMKRQQAEERRKEITDQLASSQYGIAYIDGTEHITQLNRAVENNLLSQIEFLTNELFARLGLTIEILNGTASPEVMANYYNRSIEPVLEVVVKEMRRKFLTKTARTQGQTVAYFKDPFKLIPVTSIADIADKFTRNAILTSNEVRQIVGMKPSSDPDADALRNKNLNISKNEAVEEKAVDKEHMEENQNGKV